MGKQRRLQTKQNGNAKYRYKNLEYTTEPEQKTNEGNESHANRALCPKISSQQHED